MRDIHLPERHGFVRGLVFSVLISLIRSGILERVKTRVHRDQKRPSSFFDQPLANEPRYPVTKYGMNVL